MSPADTTKSERHLLAGGIDTSNDWSDIESLGSGPHLLSMNEKRHNSIGVIPSTPNNGGGNLSVGGGGGGVTSLRELGSLLPSSAESEDLQDDAASDSHETFASFVISVTNLDLEGTQTDEWETTLVDGTCSSVDRSTSSSVANEPKQSQPTRSTVEATNQHAAPRLPSLPSHKSSSKTLKPIIRPRKPAVSAFDQENSSAASIPLVRTSGHRRVSFNSLPTPKEVHEQGVEMSYTHFTEGTVKTATTTTKPSRTKKKRSHRRAPKALNATTNFR